MFNVYITDLLPIFSTETMKNSLELRNVLGCELNHDLVWAWWCRITASVVGAGGNFPQKI